MKNLNEKYLFGMYNRKTFCFDDFVTFDSLDALVDYYRALYDLYHTGKYDNYLFADFVLYPSDYTVYEVGRLDKVPRNPVDAVKDIVCESRGDFDDLLGINKEGVEEDVERETDIYHSEQVYSDSSPRS